MMYLKSHTHKNGTYYVFALDILSETIKFLNNSVLFTISERTESYPGFFFFLE